MFFNIARKLSKDREKKETLSAALEYIMLVHRNLLEDSSGHFKKVVNVILKKYPINIISPISFQLNRGENTINSSSKKHLEKLKKTSRGS
jgi:hypothetical protein